ncbi:28S ribosomal protein S23, mitochondrial [Dicentrarchus labrax]|uniref:Small ribosomal subunit protein mS23 n=1 Tax=Dicentrarchus labrax TaxID=13489 RepID=A0A8C4DCF1_DICLA|nr:28S ribosomal protein S23, mitochondrial [Dicentrarchus labrax]
MAGSRLERVGTVFTRVRDLMRSGVIKLQQKPIWYDVYKAFPPKREPLYVKPDNRASSRKQQTVPEILYREDEVRVKFYKQYKAGLAFELSKPNSVSLCQRFVDKYMALKSCHSELNDSALFEETGKALLVDGIILRRRQLTPVAAEPRDSILKLKLADLLADQQAASANSEETTAHTTDTQAP